MKQKGVTPLPNPQGLFKSFKSVRLLSFLISFTVISLCFLGLGVQNKAHATTYYVDNSITDTNPASATPDCTNYNTGTFTCSGGAGSAYATIADVNAKSFSPDDQVLFRKGQTWREQLTPASSGTSGHPITYGAFGSGAKPIINGSNLITSGWSKDSANIWKATVTTQPNIVFMDGTLGTLVAGKASITSEYKWYWSANTLYVWSPSDGDPSGYYTNPGIEAGARDYGILCKKGYITVQDVHATHAQADGLLFSNKWTDSTVIASPQAIGVTSDYNYGSGISFQALGQDVTNILAQNSTVSYNGDAGIFIGNWDAICTGATIQDNTIDHNMWRSIAPFDITHAGISITSVGNGVSYDHSLNNVIVQRNTVTNTAYEPGIWFDTVGADVICRYNTSHDNYDGFMIEDSSSVSLYYNVSYSNTRLGIQVTRLVHNNLIYNNTTYGNGESGIAAGWTNPSAGGVTGNIFKNNISFGNTTRSFSAQNGAENDGVNGSGNVYTYNNFGPAATNFIQWGTSDYSTYAHPFTHNY